MKAFFIYSTPNSQPLTNNISSKATRHSKQLLVFMLVKTPLLGKKDTDRILHSMPS